jgi:uncharacterized protein (TIGR03435 family)
MMLKDRIESRWMNRIQRRLKVGWNVLAVVDQRVPVKKGQYRSGAREGMVFSRLCAAVVMDMLFAAGVGVGQEPAKMAFEVASIRPSGLDVTKMAERIAAGRMPRIGKQVTEARAEYNFMSLGDLIVDAYQVKLFEISGPEWLNKDRFDIIAKMPAGARKDDARAMLQSLLEDRFKLVVHREVKKVPVLALVVGKGGAKLSEVRADITTEEPEAPLKPGEVRMNSGDGPIRMATNEDGSATVNMGKKGVVRYAIVKANMSIHLEASMIAMAGLADILTQFSKMGGEDGRTVVDMTGLKGYYQVALDIPFADLSKMARAAGATVPVGSPNETGGGPAEAVSDPSGPSILQSVRRLGLNVERRKASVEQLIIDHIERSPTEN